MLAMLIDSLKQKRALGHRRSAARLLGELGATAKEAVPALLEATRDQDDELRKLAIDALKKIAPGAGAKAGAE